MRYPPCHCCKKFIRTMAVGPVRTTHNEDVMRWVSMRKIRQAALAHAQWPIVYHRFCALSHQTAEGRWIA